MNSCQVAIVTVGKDTDKPPNRAELYRFIAWTGYGPGRRIPANSGRLRFPA